MTKHFSKIYIVHFFLFYSVSCQWLAIDDFSVRTWNEKNANRSQLLKTFQVTNYPSTYTRGLENRIDTYTYDSLNENIYFIMEQPLYGISKFFKYNVKINEIDQTNYVHSFLIDQIQYNSRSNKLYSLIHNETSGQYLIEVDTRTLEIKRYVTEINHGSSSMSGSYFDDDTQMFTYHAYNFAKEHTVLVTLDLSDNASKIVVNSKPFDFNVYGFGYMKSVGLIGLWQYSIITPMVCIKIQEETGKQIQNITITPDHVKIAQGYKPFAIDLNDRLFYVLSLADDLSTIYISRIHMDTLKLDISVIKGQILQDYFFFKTI